jgi:hypothetical protein
MILRWLDARGQAPDVVRADQGRVHAKIACGAHLRADLGVARRGQRQS